MNHCLNYSCLQPSVYYKIIFFFYRDTFYRVKDFNDHSQLKFWIFINWLSVQKEPSGAIPLRECSVSVQRIYREAPIRRCGFNKVTYAALWGSLFRMGGLLWLLFCICRAIFSGGNASEQGGLNKKEI